MKLRSSAVDLANRKEWNERYGRFESETKTWRKVTLGAVSVAVVFAGCLAWQSTQSHVVPYVIEVNKLGESITVQRLEKALVGDPTRIKPQLARWIFDIRTVYLDMVAQHVLVDEAYAWINQTSLAKQQLDDFYAANQPMLRSKQGRIVVSDIVVIPGGGDQWTVDWSEETPVMGQAPVKRYFRMNIEIKPYPPMNDAQMIANPGGFYIESFNASERQR